LVVGSCLFSRGVLVQTHLNKQDTKDLVRFCQRTGILDGRTVNSPEFETIQEVFSVTDHKYHREDKTITYIRERRMLAVLAQEEELICVLMVQRAVPTGELDPYYINDVRIVFNNLRADGTLKSLHRLMSIPQIAQKSVPSVEVIDTRMLIASQEELPYMLTSGEKNCLYHYIGYSDFNGIIVSPIHKPAAEYKSLTELFFKTISSIRNMLHKRKMPTKNESSIQSHNNSPLIPVQSFTEFGIKLSNVEPTLISQSFWVVGRLYFSPSDLEVMENEFYICYEDGIPQSTVELAFKLCFGMNAF